MFKSFTPIFRISTGLAGLTVSLVLSSYVLGFIPDEQKFELDTRAKISEALAIQLSNAASRNDVTSVRETIVSIVKRNKSVISIGLRRATGKLLIAAGDHKRHWIVSKDHRSTPTHVRVPLNNGSKIWGQIEIVFIPLRSAGQIAGIPPQLAAFITFLAALGFVCYYFLLRRTLRELDPDNIVPERVQTAYDTLAEGVLILDERGIIMLANSSMAEAINTTQKSLFGTKIKDLHWKQWGEDAQTGLRPWEVAIRTQRDVTAVRMGYRTASGNYKNFMVNATCILDENATVAGVIVTFDDVTELEHKNDNLTLTVKQLQKSEEEISHQNLELQYLANHDPLTGCLNRRAFFAQFEAKLDIAHKAGQKFTCLMVDLDHFKNINDNFGHAVGDDVISGTADILKANCGAEDLVGRYGGEEFCIALIDRSKDETKWIADQIMEQLAINSANWLKTSQIITASIGVATLPAKKCSVKDIVDWADQALYEAKDTGRNRIVFWNQISEPLSSNANEPAVVAAKLTNQNVAPGTSLTDSNAVDEAVKTTKDATDMSHLKTPSKAAPLTKLPSHIIFMDRVSQSINRSQRNDTKVAVLQISIDSFERFASVFGGSAGVELVNAISQRFTGVLRQSDTISLLDGGNRIPALSRFADNKFHVELSELEDSNTITWIINRLFQSLSSPFTIGDETVYVASSIGVSIFPGDGDDAETLVRHANVAQQHARELDGTDNAQFFSDTMNEHFRRQLTLEANIRHAVDNNDFTLHFQPIVDATSGRIKALEALLRCETPNFSGMPIGMLISVAEQNGQIIEIGEWAIRTAIKQAEQWMAAGIDLPKISVNMSAIQLSNQQAMDRIMQIIIEMDLPPKKLQIEVTETAMLRNDKVAENALMRLQQRGLTVALDDFGTGQSSLSYLRRMRPDTLKIDRCFIDDITTSDADKTLVSAIVAMSQKMGLLVVAEGVETKLQLDTVRELGCDQIQGYYISKPMPVAAMTRMLQSEQYNNVDEVADYPLISNKVA